MQIYSLVFVQSYQEYWINRYQYLTVIEPLTGGEPTVNHGLPNWYNNIIEYKIEFRSSERF